MNFCLFKILSNRCSTPFFTLLNSTQLGSNVVFEFEVHLQNAIDEETIVEPKNDSRAQMKQCTYRWSTFTKVFLPPENNCVRGRKVLQGVFYHCFSYSSPYEIGLSKLLNHIKVHFSYSVHIIETSSSFQSNTITFGLEKG